MPTVSRKTSNIANMLIKNSIILIITVSDNFLLESECFLYRMIFVLSLKQNIRIYVGHAFFCETKVNGCLIRGWNCLPFASTWVHPWFLVGSVLLIICVCVFVFILCARFFNYFFLFAF